jgi:flagellar secretion chaperone FliS
MTQQTAAQAYKVASLENAPPIKIIRLLYEAAIREIERARRLDPRAEALEFNAAVHKADCIVTELRYSLNHSIAPTLCNDLQALYLFAEGELGRAMGERSDVPLVGVVKVLTTLLSAWREVEIQTVGV